METKTAKQELKNWIDSVDDQAILKSIQQLKESIENPKISWDNLPKRVKQAIQQARKDVKAGRIVSNKDFWAKYEHRL